MYQIVCDGHILFDPRDDELVVNNPKCKLADNTVGEASFTIYSNHKHYDKMEKLKSMFEILQDGQPIFRGRMTDDTKDFDNVKAVDLEGAMAFFNDSIIPPFVFPDDFFEDLEFVEAADNGNVVEYFLKWIINTHNSQVEPFQQFKIGRVTVREPDNYPIRSSEDYTKTWEILKTKLFDSSLGGHLCIRYEPDGNYIDYLKEFETVNPQKISFGENLLDLVSESSAAETYSAVLPLGKKKSEIDPDAWFVDESRLSLKDLPDDYFNSEVSSSAIISGEFLINRQALEKYGFICAPPSETTWDDVTTVETLVEKGMEYLNEKAIKLMNTITIKAVDLHFADADVESFRIYEHVDVESEPHDHVGRYQLTQLDIDIQNPQNTVITLGDTQLSMTDINSNNKQAASLDAEAIKLDFKTKVDQSKQEVLTQVDEVFNTKIAQYSREISFEIDGSLGSKASIVLTAGGQQIKDELDLSKIRQAFANDKTAVEISGGTITFNAGTIIINSNNFKVDADGVIEATSGTIGGWTLKSYKLYAGDGVDIKTVCVQAPTTNNLYVFAAGGTSHDSYADCPFRVTKAGKLYATDAIVHGDIITIDGAFKSQMDKGSLRLYYNDILCGTLNTKYWSGASTEGISLRVEEGGNYIMFSHADDTQGSGYVVDYYLNAGWSSNYDEMHIFQTSARFLSDAYFAGKTRIRSLRLFGSDGEYLVGIGSNGQLTVSKL